MTCKSSTACTAARCPCKLYRNGKADEDEKNWQKTGQLQETTGLDFKEFKPKAEFIWTIKLLLYLK